MLMTKLKSEEAIASLASGKVFIINCHGCKEIGFPEEEVNALQKKLADEGKVVGILTTDYVCNPTELALRLRGPMAKIAEADAVLVFSCGVGVQTISEVLEDLRRSVEGAGYHVAIGCVTEKREKIDMTDIIRDAETRMYQAKKQYYEEKGIIRDIR